MKVLLIKDVKSLGKAGDVKDVKDGYGKNFLIGKGFAKHATLEILEQYEQDQIRLAKELEQDIANVNKQKEMIDSLKLTIKHKIGGNGHLIGSITSKEISKSLKEQFNLDIDKKTIVLKNSIKTTGVFTVDCKLGHSIHANLTIDIIEA